MRSQSGVASSFGFTGAQTDANGLVYLRARELDSSLGRFLSRDTVVPNAPGSQGYNLYAYVANNPTTWVDPSGHSIAAAAPVFGACVETGWCEDFVLIGMLDLSLGGLVAVGGALIIVFALIACALDQACWAHVQQASQEIAKYGSAAAAGVYEWTGKGLSRSATTFPQPPETPTARKEVPGWPHGSDDDICSQARANFRGVLADDLDHIAPRHGPDARPNQSSPNGIFTDEAWYDLEALVQVTVTSPDNTVVSDPVTCFFSRGFDEKIGWDTQGRATWTLGVYVLADGSVLTAFPCDEIRRGICKIARV